MTAFGDLNPKFSLVLAISVSMNSLNFMLSRVEHEKRFINVRSIFHSVHVFCR